MIDKWIKEEDLKDMLDRKFADAVEKHRNNMQHEDAEPYYSGMVDAIAEIGEELGYEYKE